MKQITNLLSIIVFNYWTTNFKKTQSGEMKWTYKITSVKDPSNSVATRFGWISRISAAEVNVLEAEMGELVGWLLIAYFETRFVKLDLKSYNKK